MKVCQLIQMLQQADPEQEVYFAYGSADYWRTVLASPVDRAGEMALCWSDYHERYRTITEDDEEYEGKPIKQAFVLSQ